MIPERIDLYLKEHHLPYTHSTHVRAVSAQRFAAAEHVSGDRIAKPVVVTVDGELALAVVSATQRVDTEELRRALGARSVELAAEPAFEGRFSPCEVGAEPPLGLFGMPLYVDAALARARRIVMRGGTHEDAIELDTEAWLRSEGATPVTDLGRWVS
jgi:Ala-tRNA(Pro) deacylase